MSYEVISKEDAEKKEYKPWNDGIYDFSVLPEVSFGSKTYQTRETLSKAGNAMWVVVTKIFQKDGSDFASHIIDYIPVTGEMRFKHRHLAETLGLAEKYESGKLTIQDIIDKSGQCDLVTQAGSKKEDGSFYPDKNAIKDYIPRDAKIEVKDDLDDSIPF